MPLGEFLCRAGKELQDANSQEGRS
jgi:hypothetical protein